MDRQGFLTKAILLVALGVFLSILWFVLDAAGVRTMVKLGWLVSAACCVLWLVSLVGWLGRHAGHALLVAACIAVFLTVLGSQDILQEIVPYCGDGVCAEGECVAGCAQDCTAAECADGVCTRAIEDCTVKDCACGEALVCAPERKTADADGCAPVACGDDICDAAWESSATCCDDCGCREFYACEQGICFFQPPRITFTPYLLQERLGATTIAANPMLTNAEGIPHPLMAITLRNDVTPAQDVVVTFALPGFLEYAERLGTLRPGSERNITWYIAPAAPLADVRTPLRTNLTVTVAYADMQGVARTSTWTYPFTVLPRDAIDAYGSIVFFVTPADVPVEATTPHLIWEDVQRRVTLASGSGKSFPAETLARGSGSRDAIALVLASAFVHADLPTSLVETDNGLLVRVRDGTRNVMLDPTRIAGTYDAAIVQRPGYAVHEIQQEWHARNATILSLQT